MRDAELQVSFVCPTVQWVNARNYDATSASCLAVLPRGVQVRRVRGMGGWMLIAEAGMPVEVLYDMVHGQQPLVLEKETTPVSVWSDKPWKVIG